MNVRQVVRQLKLLRCEGIRRLTQQRFLGKRPFERIAGSLLLGLRRSRERKQASAMQDARPFIHQDVLLSRLLYCCTLGPRLIFVLPVHPNLCLLFFLKCIRSFFQRLFQAVDDCTAELWRLGFVFPGHYTTLGLLLMVPRARELVLGAEVRAQSTPLVFVDGPRG